MEIQKKSHTHGAVTEARADDVHVGAVPFAVDGVRRAVAVGQEDGGVVGDVGAADEGDGAEDPAHLRHAPGQRQHAGAYHGGDGVRRRRPHRPCRRTGVFRSSSINDLLCSPPDGVVQYRTSSIMLHACCNL